MIDPNHGVIMERLNNLIKSFEEHKISTEKAFTSLTVIIKEEIVPDLRKNTEFRLKTKGFIAAIAGIFGLIGGSLGWVLTRLFGK